MPTGGSSAHGTIKCAWDDQVRTERLSAHATIVFCIDLESGLVHVVSNTSDVGVALVERSTV